jgi:hypothetical protein
MTVQEWLDGYAQAWRDSDAEAAGRLFAPGALYRDQPFNNEPYIGPEGAADYWRKVTATQADQNVRIGRPIVSADGRRAAAEFWVTMLNGGAEITLTGILFLRFNEAGLCEELREAWHYAEGFSEPHETWGT